MLKLPKCVLVTGGAASGKSVFAERLAGASGLSKKYLATAQVWDDEMAAKVAQHQKQRGDGWDTLEGAIDLSVLRDMDAQDVVLLDCATMWLTRVVMDDAPVNAAIDALLEHLTACPAPVVVVTNELGQGIVPDTKLGRSFRNDHGRMNQRLAKQADWVIGVMSGLPFRLKGDLPTGLLP